jgi:hypothetical protein
MSKKIKAENPTNSEFRIARGPAIELRQTEDGEKPIITGYASVFDSLSEDLGGFRETVSKGAFYRSLKEAADIRALVDHDSGRIIGRTTSGTLRAWEDSTGLRVEIDPPDTSVARDLLTSIERGDVTGMSFGFIVREDDWSQDDDGITRELRDVDIFDVSVVTFPAYPDTSVAVRSLEVWRADTVEKTDEPVDESWREEIKANRDRIEESS